MAPAAIRCVNFWLMRATNPEKCVRHQWSILFSHYNYMSECRRSGGGSVSFRGMFVPSNTDLWHRLDALSLNELWIIDMRDDFLLRLAKYYYMVRTFNLIAGQNVSSRPRHFSPIHWNNQYQVFYLWLFIQNTVGTLLPEEDWTRVCVSKMHTERHKRVYAKQKYQQKQSAEYLKSYAPLHFILTFSKYAFSA